MVLCRWHKLETRGDIWVLHLVFQTLLRKLRLGSTIEYGMLHMAPDSSDVVVQCGFFFFFPASAQPVHLLDFGFLRGKSLVHRFYPPHIF